MFDTIEQRAAKDAARKAAPKEAEKAGARKTRRHEAKDAAEKQAADKQATERREAVRRQLARVERHSVLVHVDAAPAHPALLRAAWLSAGVGSVDVRADRHRRHRSAARAPFGIAVTAVTRSRIF